MLLSNRSIRRRLERLDSQRLVIEPLHADAVQPCSVDVHLGQRMLRWEGSTIDTRRPDDRWWRPYPQIGLPDGELGWVLLPGRFYLAALVEYLKLPDDLCGHLWNISTEARNGLLPHLAAGLLDPGWGGNATLELVVFASPTLVRPGQRIGQIEFLQLDEPSDPSYAGRYQDDREPTVARVRPDGRRDTWQ